MDGGSEGWIEREGVDGERVDEEEWTEERRGG